MKDFQALDTQGKYSQAMAIGDVAAYPQELLDIVSGRGTEHGIKPKPDNVDPVVWSKISNIIDQVALNAKSLNAQVDSSTVSSPSQTAWNGQYNHGLGGL